MNRDQKVGEFGMSGIGKRKSHPKSKKDRTILALLLLLLEIALFAPGVVSRMGSSATALSTDQYWAETGLSESDLLLVMNNENCYQSKLQFLSCINGISTAIERFNSFFSIDGRILEITEDQVQSRLTEKSELSQWKVRPQIFRERKIDFEKTWSYIKTRFVTITNRSAVLAAAINGYLSVNQDPHTYIMPIKMYEEIVSAQESRQINLGMITKRNGRHLIIRKIFEGSPASIAGLKRGDQIVKINGTAISMLLPSRINDLLKMKEGNRLEVDIERAGVPAYYEVLKGEVLYPSVSSRLIDDKNHVGVLTIHRFAKNTCTVAKEKLISFIEQNVRGVILDLRDNPGGQVDEAACVVNLFVEKGLRLFETRYLGKEKAADIYISERNPIYKGSLAVIINSGSASAAEIVAGSLKDLNRATLVGERSFGKGSFQDGRFWPTNNKIALFQTEGLYYFPSGWTPQLSGIEPDLAVAFNNVQHQREPDLYLNPVSPKQTHHPITSPATLTFLGCEFEGLGNSINSNFDSQEDPQFTQAQAYLNCGKRYGQNGSL